MSNYLAKLGATGALESSVFQLLTGVANTLHGPIAKCLKVAFLEKRP